MMADVKQFVANEDAALVGCWVRDTQLALPEVFPYFTYKPLFPDFIENEKSELHMRRRKQKLSSNVTTLTPPINAFAGPLLKQILRASYIPKRDPITGMEIPPRAVVLVVGAESQLQFGDGLKDIVGQKELDFVFFRLTSWDEASFFWDIKRTLINIRAKQIPCIIVHSNRIGVLRQILEQARDLNMLTSHYFWYFTYPDFDGLMQSVPHLHENLLESSVIIGMQLVNRDAFRAVGIMPKPNEVLEDAFLFDTATILAKAIKAQPANTAKLTNGKVEAYVSNFHTEQFTGALGDYGTLLPAPPANKGRMLMRVNAPMAWKGIYYKRNHTLGERDSDIKMDNTGSVIDVTYPTFNVVLKGVKMPEFNVKTLKVVAKLDPPLIMYDPNETPKYKGVMVDLLKKYTEYLGVDYEITKHVYKVESFHYSFRGDQETIVDYLREGKADIAIGAFGSSLQRAEVVSFTDTTMPCAVSLMMQSPKVKSDIFQFVTPFKETMWLSIFVVFIVVSILLTVMDILDWTDANFPVRDSFYYVAGVLLSGTTDTNPASFPSRMLVGCFIFFAIVTFQSYTANMAAFLTTRDEFQNIPRTLYDVATRSPRDIIALNNSEIHTLLSKAKKDPYNQIWTKLGRVANYEEALKRMRNPKRPAVLISDTSLTEYYTRFNNCELMDREQDADTIRFAMAIPFGAKYKEALNEAIGHLKTKGEDRKIIKEWYKQPPCQLEQGGVGGNLQTKSLTIKEMAGIFMTLGVGFLLSLGTAVVGELMVRYWYKKPGTNFCGVFSYFARIPGRLGSILSVWTNAAGRHREKRKKSRSPAN